MICWCLYRYCLFVSNIDQPWISKFAHLIGPLVLSFFVLYLWSGLLRFDFFVLPNVAVCIPSSYSFCLCLPGSPPACQKFPVLWVWHMLTDLDIVLMCCSCLYVRIRSLALRSLILSLMDQLLAEFGVVLTLSFTLFQFQLRPTRSTGLNWMLLGMRRHLMHSRFRCSKPLH